MPGLAIGMLAHLPQLGLYHSEALPDDQSTAYLPSLSPPNPTLLPTCDLCKPTGTLLSRLLSYSRYEDSTTNSRQSPMPEAAAVVASADTAALPPPLLPEAAARPPVEAFTEVVGGGGGGGSTAEAPRELQGRLSIASEVYLWPVARRKQSTCSRKMGERHEAGGESHDLKQEGEGESHEAGASGPAACCPRALAAASWLRRHPGSTPRSSGWLHGSRRDGECHLDEWGRGGRALRQTFS